VASYEIVGPLGQGGMGEVYRARDRRLNRDVAIKALPALVANDPDRIARFEREAQLLAALNHPNVAAIFGVEEAGQAKFLVLELVDGESLAERLRHGPLPVADALAIARQVANALEAAHEKGIIHRDIKPANVMLTADGQVKVLDFGLGKVLEAESASEVSNSPTMTLGATQAGMILGTAAYMSPEQAKGRASDKRSDVWAFGCVLYEMLVGRRAFPGDDVSDTLATVLKSEPDWTALPSDLPAGVRTLLQRCLVKDRRQRIADISTATFLLDEPALVSSAPLARGRRSVPFFVAAATVGIAIAATAVVAWIIGRTGSPAGAPGVMHVDVTLPEGDTFGETEMQPLALSADASTIVYVADRGGRRQLFVRRLDNPDVRLIAGTDDAVTPFLSPDGHWVGFFAKGKLKKASLAGSAIEVICDASNPRGASWADDDQIYFAPTNITSIWRVSASGGSPTEVTQVDRSQGEVSHRYPHVLPNGGGLVFTIWHGPGADEKTVAWQPGSGGPHRVLVRGGDSGIFVRPGSLVYARGDELLAVPFNPSKPAPASTVPVGLSEHVIGESVEGAAYASASTVLAYLAGGPARLGRRLVWVDATGKIDPVPLPERMYEQVSLSPDGQRAIVQLTDSVVGLWMYDIARATLAPFATTGGSSQAPVWTPDGKHVIYRATRNGLRNLFWKASDGASDEERLTMKEHVIQSPSSVSPDGRWLVYSEAGVNAADDLWMLPLDGDRKPRVLVASPANDGNGRISPDGKWLAFESEPSGHPEVYVQPFPGPGPRTQISLDGGNEPLWSSSGRQLFYLAGDRLMVVETTTSPGFSATIPRPVVVGQYIPSPNGVTGYAVDPASGRFLRVQQTKPALPINAIRLVLNWTDELKALGLK